MIEICFSISSLNMSSYFEFNRSEIVPLYSCVIFWHCRRCFSDSSSFLSPQVRVGHFEEKAQVAARPWILVVKALAVLLLSCSAYSHGHWHHCHVFYQGKDLFLGFSVNFWVDTEHVLHVESPRRRLCCGCWRERWTVLSRGPCHHCLSPPRRSGRGTGGPAW